MACDSVDERGERREGAGGKESGESDGQKEKELADGLERARGQARTFKG